MVYDVEGDILGERRPRGIILHQVNCLGIAGAGFAKAVRDRFPGWYEDYAAFSDVGKNMEHTLLGKIRMFEAEPGLLICSAFGQLGISKTRRMTDYGAWRAILRQLKLYVETANAENGANWEVRAPSGLGCGLGGGNPGVMRELIETHFGESPVKFLLYTPPPGEACPLVGRDLMEGLRDRGV